MDWPTSPSTTASASFSLRKMNGRSKTASSFTLPAAPAVDTTVISRMPPCADDMDWISLPSVALGKPDTLSLPPLLLPTICENLSTASPMGLSLATA
ncbi:hypothetical protein D3C78_1588610 [compost metagenome]